VNNDIEPEPETQPLPPLRAYTLTWSDNSSAGTLVVLARSEQEAQHTAWQKHGGGEYLLVDSELAEAGTYISVTTDRNPL